jgi:alcohol dehydrogenase, propanol-preferring
MSTRRRQTSMQAMQVLRPGEPLRAVETAVPAPAPDQLLVRVRACGVCCTDLHGADGDLTDCPHPITPGHEIVGEGVEAGARAATFRIGQRVGIPMAGAYLRTLCLLHVGPREPACWRTFHRLPGRRRLCAIRRAGCPFLLCPPRGCSDAEAAPLLCAGLIGHRALRIGGRCAGLAFTASAQPHTSWPFSRNSGSGH